MTQRFRRGEALAWRRIGDETVVVHLRRNTILALNPSGGAVWEALREPATLGRLTEAAYGGEAAEPERRAVAAFLAELAAEGLVEHDGDRLLAAAGPGEAADGPRILWREEVHRAAGGCAFNPAGSVACDANPFNS